MLGAARHTAAAEAAAEGLTGAFAVVGTDTPPSAAPSHPIGQQPGYQAAAWLTASVSVVSWGRAGLFL